MENMGDLLFADVVAAQLKDRLTVDELVRFSPVETTIPNTNWHTYSVADLEDHHRDKPFDAIVVGGGDLAHLRKVPMLLPHISNDWMEYDVLGMWTVPSIVADKYDIPLAWNAPGVPIPFVGHDNFIVRYLCDAVDYLSVRDPEAKRVLATAVPEELIKVVPDSVLSIARFFPKDALAQRLAANGLFDTQAGDYLFFQATNKFSEEQLAQCVEGLRRIKEATGLRILVQSIGYSMGDEEVIQRMAALSDGAFETISAHPSQHDLLALIAGASYYIGGSLHGCIIASAYGVPHIVPNVYHYNKITGFLEMAGRPEACIYELGELYDTFLELQQRPAPDASSLVQRVEAHFDHIAQLIEGGRKTTRIEGGAKRLSDYIYVTSLQGEQVAKLTSRCAELEQALEAANQRVADIEASTSWKVTGPLRKLTGRLHR